MTQAAHTKRDHLQQQRMAWAWMLAFFGLFCALVASVGYGGWRYYSTATTTLSDALLRSHVNAGVIVQLRGRLNPESIERLPPEYDPCPGERDICTPLGEGSVIRTQTEAGYGPVASLVLADQSQIDFWAHPNGAELSLKQYRATLWNDARFEVTLRQDAGYLRYDIASGQSYQQVDYLVEIGDDVLVRLMPGGSYSINVPVAETGRPPSIARTGGPLRVEVAARSGSAHLSYGGEQMVVRPGQLAQVDSEGALYGPDDAHWELIRDGGFAQYREQNEYGDQSQTWRKLWTPNAPGMTAAEQNGRFVVVRACRPETPDLCTPENQIAIGQFRRDGQQTRPFTTGIEQTINADVSEYTSLRLSAWVRVLTQTVQLAGVAGSECPIMVQLVYKPTSPTDQELNRYFCIYTGTNAFSSTEDVGEIRYRQVPPFQWYQLNVELRDDSLLRQARYLQTIRIEARGHDYLSEITEVSLIGQQ